MSEAVVIETLFAVKDQAANTALQTLNKNANAATHSLTAAKKALHGHGEAGRHAGQGMHHASHGAHELKEKLHEVKEHGMEAREQLLELAAGVGIAVGLKSLAEKFIELNSETENATRSMGAMMAGLWQIGGAKEPAENLRASLERAGEVMEKFGESSMKLGIPREQLAAMARSLAPALASAHKQTEDMVGVTNRLAILARAAGQGFEESASAVNMFVRNGVAARSPLMTLLGLHGRFEKMSAKQRMAMVEKRIAAFHPEQLEQVRTFSDLVGRVRAQVEILTEEAGKPLFEAAKTQVQALGDWIGKNREQIQATAKVLADKFVTYLHAGVDLVKAVARHWDEAKAAVEALAAVWATVKIGGELKGLAQSFSGALQESGSNMGKAAGTAMGMAAKGVMVAEAAMIGWTIGKAIGDYLDKNTDLFKPKASKAEVETSAAAEAMRAHDRDVFNALDRLTSGAGAGSSTDFAELRRQAEKGMAWASSSDKGVGKTVQLKLGDISKYMIERLGVDPKTMMALGPKEPPKPKEAPKDVAKNLFDFRYSQFDITQKFAEALDPDRLAVGFANSLSTLGERKVSSNFIPVGTTR